jgi:hypothetical protein
MESINLKTIQKIPVDVSVTIPSFYRSKDEKEWVALMSKDNVVSISIVGDNVWLSKQGIDTADYKIVEAASSYHSCTESEFVEKFDNVMEQLYSHPKLAV